MRLTDPTTGLSGSPLEHMAPQGHSLAALRAFWDEVARVTPPAPGNPTPVVDEIAELVGRAGTVLEVGCGRGGLLAPLAALRADDGTPRFQVHGVDVSPLAVEDARRAVGDAPNVSLHVGNGYDLAELPDASFDAVVSTHTFQGMPKPLALNNLKEARRVLRMGGRLWLQVPNILREDRLLAFNHFAQPHFAEIPIPMNFYGPFEIVRLLVFTGFWVLSVSDSMVVTAGVTGRTGGDALLSQRLARMACELSGLPVPPGL